MLLYGGVGSRSVTACSFEVSGTKAICSDWKGFCRFQAAPSIFAQQADVASRPSLSRGTKVSFPWRSTVPDAGSGAAHGAYSTQHRCAERSCG